MGMNDAILLQQAYAGHGMDVLLDMTQGRHLEYCQAHEFEYCKVRTRTPDSAEMENGHWVKVELIRQALISFRYVVWLDADTVIENLQADLRLACRQIGAVKLYTPHTFADHFNVGALYFENSDRTRTFVETWLAGYPGPQGQREQGVFNALAGEYVQELSPTWNYTLDRHFGLEHPIVRGFHSVRGAHAKQTAMAACFSKELQWAQ